MPKEEIYVGVDLGGTSLRALAVGNQNRILSMEKTAIEPVRGPAGLIRDIAGCVRRAVDGAGVPWSRVQAVSVGAPGAVGTAEGIVYMAPNLGWKDVRLAAKLKSLLQVPVLLENDVNAGTVGEHALGAGQGSQDMVGIFVGTGIGGGLILNGELHEGFRGAAAEIGHIVLQPDGPLCGCGKRGCVEALASRTAMERDVRLAIRGGASSIVPQIMQERQRDRMTSSIIARAMKSRDAVMRQVMKRAQFYLGLLAANVVNVLDPEALVFGGGIAERLQESFVGPIRSTALKYFMRQDGRERIRIVPGTLGDNAGALGAVVLARRRLG
jgi:glucokinase